MTKHPSSMERLNWNNVLDHYLMTQKMRSEDYEALNEIQVAIIQELKKSFSRLGRKCQQEYTKEKESLH